MRSFCRLAIITLVTFVAISFAQDVTLTLDGNDLNYVTNQPIAGFQFNHDDCVSSASGGDSGSAGFMVSSNASTVIGFSMTGATFGDSGAGTMIVLSGDCTEADLSNFIISNAE